MTAAARLSIRRLARLRRHQISPGEPDIRGWLVIGADGRRIGRVRDLLINMSSLRTQYVDVAFDPAIAAGAGRTSVVLPVECLRTDPVRPYIHVLRVAAQGFVDLPDFESAPVGPAEELRLRRFFRCDDEITGPDAFWRPRRRERACFSYVCATTD